MAQGSSNLPASTMSNGASAGAGCELAQAVAPSSSTEAHAAPRIEGRISGLIRG